MTIPSITNNEETGVGQSEHWEVRRSETGFDVCLPHVDGDRGCAVVATVFSGEKVACLIAAAPDLYAAAQAVIDRMFSTYRARNGRDVGIQGDDGEQCWIVHSDDIERLSAALTLASGAPK